MSHIFHTKGIVLAIILAFSFFHFFSCLFSSALPDQASIDKDDIPQILENFFKTGDISQIRPLLAEEARIFLSLEKVKSAKGFFSAHQTLLIFRDFFQHNNAVSVRIESSQEVGSPPLTIKASLIVRDINSKINAIDLSITLQKQADFWKIKEIKETGS